MTMPDLGETEEGKAGVKADAAGGRKHLHERSVSHGPVAMPKATAPPVPKHTEPEAADDTRKKQVGERRRMQGHVTLVAMQMTTATAVV